jgi:hypothetical protein
MKGDDEDFSHDITWIIIYCGCWGFVCVKIWHEVAFADVSHVSYVGPLRKTYWSDQIR